MSPPDTVSATSEAVLRARCILTILAICFVISYWGGDSSGFYVVRLLSVARSKFRRNTAAGVNGNQRRRSASVCYAARGMRSTAAGQNTRLGRGNRSRLTDRRALDV